LNFLLTSDSAGMAKIFKILEKFLT